MQIISFTRGFETQNSGLHAHRLHVKLRIDDLCRKLSNPPGFDDIRLMLCNIENPELPIYRMDPDDPDKENNLATALFRVTPNTIHSRVYVAGDQAQAFTYT